MLGIVKILKSFSPIRAPRAIISDRGTHFFNDKFDRVMFIYGVTHRLRLLTPSNDVKLKSNRGRRKNFGEDVPHADGSNFKSTATCLIATTMGGDTPPLVIPDLQTFPKDN
ncbi:reverse transcriptase domain-containing protein [Tanacetum coccineum]